MRLRIFMIGFTLIELMIVVAIISILASIAIPSYQHYIQKARFTEILTAVEPYKIAIAIALQEGTDLKKLTNGSYGIPTHTKATKNVKEIQVKNGVITVIASKTLQEITYILKPSSDGTEWQIAGSCLKLNLCHA